MSPNLSGTQPSIDLTPTTALLNGSPKSMYVFFLLSLAKNYFEVMRVASPHEDIESATAALIAFCPNKTKREELWELYITRKEGSNKSILTASVYTIGDLISYLSETLEFEEESTGGLL